LLLYRWPRSFDKWGIEGKDGVIQDFKVALDNEYVWRPGRVPVVYGVEWVQHTTPSKVSSGTRHNIDVKLRNTGNAPWECDGEMSVSLRSRWYSEGKPLSGDAAADTLTRLPNDVAPKALVTVKAVLRAPSHDGNLVVAWDLVDAGGTWSDRKCTPLRVPVAVEPPAASDEVYFESTKCSVRGAFLEFFRLHGEEVTGYPITEQFVDRASGLNTQVFQRVVMEEADGVVRLKPAGEYLQQAKSEIALLLSQAEELRRQMLSRGIVPPPSVADVTETLPRDQAAFLSRDASQVRYLVIHHSGLAKDADLQSIALAHRDRGWGGIIYQFYIDRSGKVFRTNPDDQVVSSKEEWSAKGLNICFAGHFGQEMPSDSQIASGGQLCAWLLQAYGLTSDAIVGISKFYATDSPGSNWTGGGNWRALLLAQIEKARSSADSGAGTEPGDLAALRSRVRQLQQEAEDMARQVAVLEQQNRQLRSQCGQSGVLPPTIEDITDALPRDAAGLKKRELASIKCLIIHHTALPPSVDAARVAASHRTGGWPSIMYHFFIDHLGQIQQTNSLQHYVSDASQWLRDGVNICFAGDFDQVIPSDAQLASGGHLCAWLLSQLELPPDRIQGAQELFSTQSPGAQWLQGRKWKALLGEAVTQWQDAGPSSAAEIEQLRAKVAELQAGLSAAQTEAGVLAEERDQLQARVNDLQEKVSRLQAGSADTEASRREILALQAQVKKTQERIQQLEAAAKDAERRQLGQVPVAKPVVQDIVDELPKHETLTYSTRALSDITHIAVHHSAATASVDPKRIAEYHIKEDSTRSKAAWPGIGYHYYLMPDGTVYQTNRHETVSYHAGGNNDHTLGICFAGSFMDVVPTPNQLRSGGHLIAWLIQQLNLPEENVWGHKEYPNNHTTLCPGKQWLDGLKWKEMLLRQTHSYLFALPDPLDKPIRHYMLFWWRSPDLWATKDWANARNYIARFRPDCGFSEDAAMHAEYVLIVGGTAGISGQSEHKFRQAGCQVERVEGVDEADTKKRLDALVASNRPFNTLAPAKPWWA
jgi:N-acetyl-anhydromuramyl-L-alanine amidase AmpD